jgi:hypothetical protein
VNNDVTFECPECGRQKQILAYRGAKRFSCCHEYVALVQGVEHENFMLKADYSIRYRKLVVVHVHPPIPVRQYDWQAFLGDEEGGPHGWGETRHDAIVDLLVELDDQLDEVADRRAEAV